MVLGPVEFTTDSILGAEVPRDFKMFLYEEGKPPIPVDV